MSFPALPLFRLFGHEIAAAGLFGFIVVFGVGLLLGRFLQGEWFRRLLTRLKLGKTFATIVLSLAALIFFVIMAVNVGRCSTCRG